MRRGWLVLMAVVLLAGCSKSPPPAENVTPASTDDPLPPEDGPVPSSPSPTPATGAPPTTSTPPSSGAAGNGTPPAPAPRADLWLNKTGWAAPDDPASGDANTTVKVPFQVLAGAKNLTVSAYVEQPSAVPDAVPRPWKPVALNLTLVDPTGKVVRSESSVQTGPTAWASVTGGGNVLAMNATALRIGDHTLVAVFTGAASDGSSVGDKWHATVHVSY